MKVWKKLSCQLLFILLTQNCSMTTGNGYKQFHHFTPRALFFPFVVHFNAKLSVFLRHAIAVVDLAWSHGLVLWVHEAPSKYNPMPLVQMSLERIRFTFRAKSNRVLASRLDIKPFFQDCKYWYLLRFRIRMIVLSDTCGSTPDSSINRLILKEPKVSLNIIIVLIILRSSLTVKNFYLPLFSFLSSILAASSGSFARM